MYILGAHASPPTPLGFLCESGSAVSLCKMKAIAVVMTEHKYAEINPFLNWSLFVCTCSVWPEDGCSFRCAAAHASFSATIAV